MQSLHPLPHDLGLGPVLARLEASNGGLVADACRKTVRTIVRNCAENVENHIAKVNSSFFFEQNKCPSTQSSAFRNAIVVNGWSRTRNRL